MQTIFITSFHPLISRNILSTGLLSRLSAAHRVIIFAPAEKEAYFRETFGGERITVQGIAAKLSARDIFFRRLALDALPTQVMYMKKRLALYTDKNIFAFLLTSIPTLIFGHSLALRSLARWLDYHSLRRKIFAPYLRKFQPALVFSTDVQNEFDVRLLQESKRLGIPHLAMVRSWDNLTAKGIIRMVPERLLVHNDIIRDEAVRYNDVPPERITAIGIPHYDAYRAPPKISRDDFFGRFGLDPRKKLILWAPIGDRYIRNNRTDRTALEAASALDANILVRLPPQDTVDLAGFKSRRATVVFDRTGTRSWAGGVKSNELSREDDERLAASLAYCDAVVTGHSTISIDAACFNRPTVLIYFDAEPRNYWDSFRRYLDREYLQPVIHSGGVRLAHDPRELVSLVQAYLDDPARDGEGRARIVREEVGALDGGATQRLADVLLSYVR